MLRDGREQIFWKAEKLTLWKIKKKFIDQN